ncbi:amidohydrolase family protein [Roseococcus sp.]|uniref:amidohydrolase family protein n=1 Tax=Roseococcus sp. TaxID=2109646 RepID=UPI003BAC5C06
MTPAILIHDATIVTADADGSVHHGASIAIEGDRIAAIGATEELKSRYPHATMVDGRNRAVMPGFANTHTHLHLTLARGIFEDMSSPNAPPFDAVNRLPLPRLSDEEHMVMCQLGALEAIRSGTTALLEDNIGIARYAGPLADTGLRLLLAERAWDKAVGNIGGMEPFEASEALADAGLERISRLHEEWNGARGGRVAVGLAAWAPDMCSPRLLNRLSGLSEKLDARCTIHLNQLWGEVEAVRRERKCLPTEYLHAEGFLNDRLIAAHCRCMVPREEELLGRSGASVAFNSCMAARRGLSPRIAALQEAGCNISIGTDNMAEDMVEATRTAMFMERVRRSDGREPTPEEALGWATRNGYRAMGVADGGTLAPGMKADLVVLRTDRPHLVPRLRLVSNFVHQGQASDVQSVMVDGAWIMRDGEVLTMDEAAIVAEADLVARRAWARLFAARPELEVPPGFSPAP